LLFVTDVEKHTGGTWVLRKLVTLQSWLGSLTS